MSDIALLENPFYLLPLNSEKYLGPDHVLNVVLQTVGGHYPEAVGLIGLLGQGKSALLRHLAAPGMLARYASHFHSAYQAHPEQLLPILVNFDSMPDAYSPAAYIYQRYQDAFLAYRLDQPGLVAADSPVPLPELFEEMPDQPLVALTRHLRALHARRIRPVWLFDDLDAVFIDFHEEQLQQLSLWRSYTSFIIASTKPLHLVNQTGSEIFGFFNTIYLSGLLPDEAYRMLSEPAEEAGVKFPEDDLEYLVRLVGKFPAALIRGGGHLWELRRQLGLLEDSRPLNAEQQAVLRAQLHEQLGRRFRAYYDGLDGQQQEVLKRIVQGRVVGLTNSETFQLERLGLILWQAELRPVLFAELFAEAIKGDLPDAVIGQIAVERSTLTEMEGRLFDYLWERAGQLCASDAIWDAVWEKDVVDEKQMHHLIQVTISRLKQKLPGDIRITNVRGRGYILQPAR
jgi:hypothetical protein